MRDTSKEFAVALRSELAWQLWMLRRASHEVRRLELKLARATRAKPDVSRLIARYQREAKQCTARVLELRTIQADNIRTAYTR